MRTPEYNNNFDPLDEALNYNTTNSNQLSKEQELRQVQYVFNPSSPINTSNRYHEYPLLHRGRWTMIAKSVSEVVTIGDLTGLQGPQKGTKPIYPQWIAEEFSDAYSYLGVRIIGSFTGLEKELAAFAQRVILPELPATNPELLLELDPEKTKKRIEDARAELESLGAKFDITDLVKRTYQAADQMWRATEINCEDLNAYIQRSLHELSEGRAGRPGKTILDRCDTQYMRLMGVEIPDDLLTYRIKPQQDVAAAVTQGVTQAVSALQAGNQQAMDAATLASVVSTTVAQTLQALGLVPASAPVIKTPEVVKNGGK